MAQVTDLNAMVKELKPDYICQDHRKNKDALFMAHSV